MLMASVPILPLIGYDVVTQDRSMRSSEIEFWAFYVIQRVESEQPHEGPRVELKAEWPDASKVLRLVDGRIAEHDTLVDVLNHRSRLERAVCPPDNRRCRSPRPAFWLRPGRYDARTRV